MTNRNIGLCLSGGGVRALVFHLGVLKWMAQAGLWNQVRFISTVSGASLGTALVFEFAGQRWPNSDEFLSQILPKINKLLVSWDLEAAYKRAIFLQPWLLFRGRANVIAHLIKQHWGIHGNVRQMPVEPRWIINTTCYETGKNFRFMQQRMGDFITQYVLHPDFNLAEAVAASAAVPGLIGPLSIRTNRYQWVKFPTTGIAQSNNTAVQAKPLNYRIQLWDGGVYDNLGSEALFKPETGLREGVDFLVVSDASKPLGIELRRFQLGIPPYIAPIRLVDAATDQVRSLRTRTLVEYFEKNTNSGVYLKMGDTGEAIYQKTHKPQPNPPTGSAWLSAQEVITAASMETTLRRLAPSEYQALFNHGFEVINSSMNAYYGLPLV